MSEDPGRGAAYYVTKHIARPNCEFMLSDNIEAFRRRGSELQVVGSNEASDRGDDSLSASNCQHSSYEKSFPQPRPLSGLGKKRMKMKIERRALPGPPHKINQENLAEQAIELDVEIKAAVKVAQRSLTEVGRLLSRMKESRLWEHLPRHYRGWEDYARSVLGPKAHSSLQEFVTAYSLTEGSNPISPEDVDRMGPKKAAQVARLAPEQRTMEIREIAQTEPVAVVRNKVQAILNETLPPDQQKPMLQLLAINLPEEYVDEFEELMEVGIEMEGIRDGDDTQSRRAKVFHSMMISFQEYMAPELSEALEYIKAKRGLHDSPAASAQEDFPEEEEGLDFSDEQAHP
jgi:hypothetical protein